jgi:diadenosine tetraphosphate (Ap4A) HIT family hydrolase
MTRRLSGMINCKSCQMLSLRDSGDAPLWDNIYRAAHWDLVHNYNTSLPGWLALVARRHVATIAELTPAEAVELGRLLPLVSQALQQVVGCQKTYVVQFADHPDHPHVHFHVIPITADLPAEKRGPGVFSHLGAAEEERVSQAAMNEIAAKVRDVLLLIG